MEAKDKAKELFNKFKAIKIIFFETESGQTKEASSVVTDELAKQCAIIAVDEILSFEVSCKIQDCYVNDYREYWKEVKKELKQNCTCDAPLIRTGVDTDEYCGICGKDIK